MNLKIMTTREKIIQSVLDNYLINDYLDKVDLENRKDFKQYIWLTIMELIENKYDKMEALFESKTLGKFIMGLMNNQLKSNTSPYSRLYKNKQVVMEINDDMPSIVEEDHTSIHNKKIKDILNILDNIHLFDMVLFKLHFGIDTINNELVEPLTYRQIEKQFGIKYNIIRKSVIKTHSLLKNG